MRRIIILGNKEKMSVLEALDEIRPWLAERAEVMVDLEMEAALEPEQVDFGLVLGGDGSMLRAARRLGGAGVPLLGINVGKFGFLTETSADRFQDVLNDVLAGHYRLAERMMLRCVLERDGDVLLDTPGLNDAVISRTALSRLITIEFRVDAQRVTTYRADGLIVATPVGSTAHSLASGGPIVHPELNALVVTPICPHTLSNRPLVLPPEVEITLTTTQFSEPPALTVDGQMNRELRKTDRVRIRRCETPLKLIRTGRMTFFETLCNKLDWRGQPRYV